MNKPSLQARARGLAVVRKGTVFVTAVAVAGTGAFAAIQAKAYDASHPGGGAKTTGSQGVAPQKVTVTQDSSEHDGEGHDDHEEHDDGGVTTGGSFSPPAAAPANAGGSAANVVSGGS